MTTAAGISEGFRSAEAGRVALGGAGALSLGIPFSRDDLRDDARAHRLAPLPNRKPQPLIHRNRRNQLPRQPHIVPRHHHLHPRRQRHHPRHVRRPKVKLRPIPIEKRRVPAPLLLRQHVHLRLELRVRRDAPRLRQHHPPLHLLLLRPPQQHPNVVPRLPLVQHLAKHLHPRHHRAARRPQPHDLHLPPPLLPPPLPPPPLHPLPPPHLAPTLPLRTYPPLPPPHPRRPNPTRR